MLKILIMSGIGLMLMLQWAHTDQMKSFKENDMKLLITNSNKFWGVDTVCLWEIWSSNNHSYIQTLIWALIDIGFIITWKQKIYK